MPIQPMKELTVVTVKIMNKETDNGSSKGSSSKISKGNISSSRPGKTDKRSFTLSEMPQFPGGDGQLSKYIKDQVDKKFKDNSELKKKTTVVYFIVNAKGKVVDATIEPKISKEVDQELTDIMLNMPDWKPADHRGRVKYTLVVSFD